MYQIILFTLNIYNVYVKLYLSKAAKTKEILALNINETKNS